MRHCTPTLTNYVDPTLHFDAHRVNETLRADAERPFSSLGGATHLDLTKLVQQFCVLLAKECVLC